MRSRTRSNTRARGTILIIREIISRAIIAKAFCLLTICELAEIGVCLSAKGDVALYLETGVIGVGVALGLLEGGHT